MIHELKIKPEYFAAVVSGDKTFEIRNNADRNFQVGDTLLLKAWDGEFTGDFVEKVVSYITDFEQKPGYVVMGLANKREQELAEQIAYATSQCSVMAELLREVTKIVPAIGVAIDDLPIVDAFLERVEMVLAGKQQSNPVTITETILTAPERIWLQVGDQAGYGDYPFPEHHDEVTWCADSVVACEVPYVRADLAGKVSEQHKTNWPDKCPITRRDFFMEIDGVPTYGGPYDSYTIPEMLGTPEQPWHERELFVRRFDHDEGRWVDDEVISQRVIHDGVLDELLDLKEQQADQSGVAPQGGEPCATEPPSSSPA